MGKPPVNHASSETSSHGFHGPGKTRSRISRTREDTVTDFTDREDTVTDFTDREDAVTDFADGGNTVTDFTDRENPVTDFAEKRTDTTAHNAGQQRPEESVSSLTGESVGSVTDKSVGIRD